MVKVATRSEIRQRVKGDVLSSGRTSLFFAVLSLNPSQEALARSGDLAGLVPFFCGLQSLVPQLEALARFSDMTGSVPFFGGNRTDRTDRTYKKPNEKFLQGPGTVFSKRVPGRRRL